MKKEIDWANANISVTPWGIFIVKLDDHGVSLDTINALLDEIDDGNKLIIDLLDGLVEWNYLSKSEEKEEI